MKNEKWKMKNENEKWKMKMKNEKWKNEKWKKIDQNKMKIKMKNCEKFEE